MINQLAGKSDGNLAGVDASGNLFTSSIIRDEYGRYVKTDYSTGAMNIIDYPHHEIHAGSHFFCSIYDSDVDTAAPKYFRITTPNTTKWGHLLLSYVSVGSGIWEFFENPTISDAGTSKTIYNSNRNSANTATLTVYENAKTTSDGTKLFTDLTGDNGVGGVRMNGNSSRDNEIVLKQNEDYILKFTPDADNAKVVIDIEFYEHTNLT